MVDTIRVLRFAFSLLLGEIIASALFSSAGGFTWILLGAGAFLIVETVVHLANTAGISVPILDSILFEAGYLLALVTVGGLLSFLVSGILFGPDFASSDLFLTVAYGCIATTVIVGYVVQYFRSGDGSRQAQKPTR